MNPNNGEILAMANAPGYDPNSPYEEYENFEGDTENDKIQNMWRNSIVSDTYEPGSTFKIITMAAAMEEGLIHDDDVFVCKEVRPLEMFRFIVGTCQGMVHKQQQKYLKIHVMLDLWN